jgi:hypothetical protein
MSHSRFISVFRVELWDCYVETLPYMVLMLKTIVINALIMARGQAVRTAGAFQNRFLQFEINFICSSVSHCVYIHLRTNFLRMNPEKATDYLSRVNWKSLVEWMTAEAILNRPANPIQFCRDLLGEKLAEQDSADFRPDNITEWLRSCYTEATALVDEHGIIQGKTLETAQQSLPEQVTELRRKVDGMQQLLDASSTIATLDPHQATDNIVAETCRILNCDRATIFTVDMITKELVLCVAEGAKNIRVPIGQGIAGTVAATGETINIVDAYADSRFSSRYTI